MEKSFGLPVLAEIPKLPWGKRRRAALLSAEQPASGTAEAYRVLRSAVLLLRPSIESAQTGRPRKQETRVALVTSARAGEGKTTTVANLAIALAETGRRVLVLSLDFRNPRLHEYLGVKNGDGLSEVLESGNHRHLAGVVADTAHAGVRIATSGGVERSPGALLASAGRLITQARGLADVVLVDTPPLLVASDAVDLAQHADAVLLVGRLNRTTRTVAEAARRVVSRLGVPALGVVLVGVPPQHPIEGYLMRPSQAERLADRVAPARSTTSPDRSTSQEARDD